MKKIILLLAVLSGCYSEKTHEINCEFQGGIILSVIDLDQKSVAERKNVIYSIKYKGVIYDYIMPYEIDAHYQAGDTINGNCIK